MGETIAQPVKMSEEVDTDLLDKKNTLMTKHLPRSGSERTLPRIKYIRPQNHHRSAKQETSTRLSSLLQWRD